MQNSKRSSKQAVKQTKTLLPPILEMLSTQILSSMSLELSLLHLSKEYPTLKNILTEVQTQNLKSVKNLLKGINKFSSHDPIKALAREVVHQIGSCQLLKYSNDDLQPILVVPSLINRHTILDLNDKNSFMLEIKAKRLSPYLINWGEPATSEENLTLAGYIDRLIEFSNHIIKQTGRKMALVGYCMGGQLSVAASYLYPKNFNGLITIATPWSFNHADFDSLRSKKTLQLIKSSGSIVNATIMKRIFYYKNIFDVNRKYQAFAEDRYDEANFMQIESWANDCIGITKNVLVELIENFIVKQDLANNRWMIQEKLINLNNINIRSLCIMAKQDRIAPLEDCMPLYKQLNKARLEVFDTGHVGMIVNRKYKLAQKIKEFTLTI